MFEMTDQQKQAFSDATNGVSAQTFNHSILFLVGALAIIWLLMVFIGTIKNKERSLYESLQEFAWAVFIFVAVGVVIYFT